MAGKYDEAYQALDAVPFKAAGAYSDGAVFHMAQYLTGEGNAAEARKLRRLMLGQPPRNNQRA